MVPSIYQTWYHTTVLGQHIRDGEHYRDKWPILATNEQGKDMWSVPVSPNATWGHVELTHVFNP